MSSSQNYVSDLYQQILHFVGQFIVFISFPLHSKYVWFKEEFEEIIRKYYKNND